MKDLETGTLWSHILGEAMRGELKGERLTILPAVITPWSEWKRRHPDTTILALRRTSREFVTEFQKNSEIFVLGIGGGAGDKLAFSFDVMSDEKILNDRLNGESIVATFDPDTTEAHCFARETGGRTLTFKPGKKPGRMTDRETGSVWDSERGICLAGSMKGSELDEIPAMISFRNAWFTFHPDSRLSKRTDK